MGKLKSHLEKFVLLPFSIVFGLWAEMVFKKVVVLMMGCLGLSKQPTLPAPQPESGGSSVVDVEVCPSQRIRLSDGRILAYTERGVPKNKSNYSVIIVHGFASSKEMEFMASQVDNPVLMFSFVKLGFLWMMDLWIFEMSFDCVKNVMFRFLDLNTL